MPKPCAARATRRAAAAERKSPLAKRRFRPLRRCALFQQLGHLVIPRCALLSMLRCAAMPLESDLYAPVKALLEGQGYVVKGEVRGCDVVAVRGREPPVIVELKRHSASHWFCRASIAWRSAIPSIWPSANGPSR